MPPNKKELLNEAALKRIELIISKTLLKLVIALPISIMMATQQSSEHYYLSLLGWLLVIALLFWDVLCCMRKS